MTEEKEVRDPNEFPLARAKAINTYAALEESMARLFTTLMQAESRKSYFVFSRLISPRAKREVLAKLIELNYESKFDEFFPSVMKLIGRLDTPRNKIVHWIAKTAIPAVGPFTPPNNNFLRDHPDIFSGEKMLLAQLVHFTEQAEFLQLLLFYFDIYLNTGQRTDEPGHAWPDIFQQRCIYPPPKEHPLVQLRARFSAPPGSSPA